MSVSVRDSEVFVDPAYRNGEPAQTRGMFAVEALTFDDVLLSPGYAEMLPSQVDISMELHPRLRLNIPVLSAAMDTVIRERVGDRAGAAGRAGRDSPQPDAGRAGRRSGQGEAQRERHDRGSDHAAVQMRRWRDAEQVMSRYHISGVPITDEDGQLVGHPDQPRCAFCRG